MASLPLLPPSQPKLIGIAKLAAQGHPVYFHEPREGGHPGATDNAHLAFNIALSFAFLRKMMTSEVGSAK